jgi:uncharacterized protein (TIGR03000 family)
LFVDSKERGSIMFRKLLSMSVVLTSVVALVLATPTSGQARGRGGHIGGSRHNSYHGGVHNNGRGRGRAYYPLYGLDYTDPYYTDANPYFAPGATASPPPASTMGITDSATFNTFTYTPPAGRFSAVYPPIAPPKGAAITVKAPSNSLIWFDGTLMAPGGTVRKYFSPPLAPGNNYLYEILARWQENGHEVTQSKKVEISAAAKVSVDFPLPTPSATAAAPPPDVAAPSTSPVARSLPVTVAKP